MTNSKAKPLKVLALSIEFVFWQVLFFFVCIYVLSFIDDLLSVLLDYDSPKSHTSIVVRKYSLVFLFLVALPRTAVAFVDKPQLLKAVTLLSVILMSLYLMYDYYRSFEFVTSRREFCTLLLSLLVATGLTLKLLKELPNHLAKKI